MSPSLLTSSRRVRHDQGGFTLVEVLVAMTLGLLMTTAVLFFMNTGFSSQSSAAKASTALNEQRVGLERMTREIRQATSFSLVNSQVVDMTTYVPGSNTLTQRRVRYDCSAGEVCRRSEGPAGGAFTQSDVEIVAVVQNADVFDPQPVLNPTYVAIALKVRAQGTESNPERVLTLRDGVDIRNNLQ